MDGENDLVLASPDEFETRRLLVRRLREDDLEAILPVHTSNPDYLELTEGSGGQPGRYDLEMLQRDYVIAQMTPGRCLAGIFLKPTGEAVGVLDWMEENPSDGKPWIGLLMVHADHQRQRIASEAFRGLAEWLRARRFDVVRAGVIERDAAGRAFATSLGFELVAITPKRMAAAEERTIVVERSLA